MSYNKTTWVNGDVITAEKMNNIEDGIEGASDGGGADPLVINGEYDSQTSKITLDTKWETIYSAFEANRPIVLAYGEEGGVGGTYVSGVIADEPDEDYYAVIAFIEGQRGFELATFVTSTSTGYPSCSVT